MERLRDVVRDEYDVMALLGFGGMAGVFLAQERRLRRRVALKVMSPELMLGHHMIERFHQEAVTQANLDHPNIAGVYGVREQGGLQFFAMQYVPGRTVQSALRKEIEEGRLLDFGVVRALLYQVGTALEYAHACGVIHRDVKPGNVLLAADGRAVVTDFGIAKVAQGPALTATNMVQGTAAYMSPEQCYASELTGASDQYSLGILAHELVTGHVPFTGDGFSVMQAHVTKDPPLLTAERAGCPPELSEAVYRMLAKNASDRFPSISAALEAMRATSLSPRRDDSVRLDLIRLAACDEVFDALGEHVRRAMYTPHSSESIGLFDSPGPSAPGGQLTSPVAPVRRTPQTPPAVAPSVTGAATVVGSLEIAAHPSVVALGERVQLRAVCRNVEGVVIPAAARWSGDAPQVAAVDDTGTIVGAQWGRVRVRASAGAASAESVVVIGSVPLRLEVRGLPATIPAGSATAFHVQLFDVAGQARDVPLELTTSDPRIAEVTFPATVHALQPGIADVIVRCGTAEHRTAVRVMLGGAVA